MVEVLEKECEYLDGLSKEMGWNIRHAKNGGQYQVCGYSVDGYDETRNIIVEYDEPYHYTVEGEIKTKDIDRMNKIIQHTGCRFYRYNERTRS
jgi:very-short-patch-repair endonuclease